MKKHQTPHFAIPLSPLSRAGSSFSDSDPGNTPMLQPRGPVGPQSDPNLGGGQAPVY